MAKKSGGRGYVSKLAGFEFLGQPVGKALVWTAGFGLAKGFGGMFAKFLPLEKQSVGGVQITTNNEMVIAEALLAVVVQLKPVKRFIGDGVANVVATAAWVDIVQKLTGIDKMIETWLNPVAMIAAPAAAAVPQKGIIQRIGEWLTGSSFLRATVPGSVAQVQQQLAAQNAASQGLGDIDTLVPIEGAYDQFQGFGADAMMLTSLEEKLAAIAG